MTMNKITAKLLRHNREQYQILGLCIFLSVLLVSSFTLMFFSPTIQEFLPPGGDTRKLMWLMLGVVVLGCLLFTLYGSSLFFRKKSREFGVMLALGAEKRALAGQLTGEILSVVGKYVLSGILLAVPVSYLIWKLFQMMVITPARIPYRIGIIGVLAGICFAAMLSLCILILGIRFIRRADIIAILNASRKTEMVREIHPWTGKAGIILVFLGLFLAMAVPQLTVRFFHQGVPGLWNATYLLAAAGLYLFLLSAVAHTRMGKNPERYYRNIISTSLMRFTARQTTRNMCVIALLVFVMELAAFWGVMYYHSATESGSEAPYDHSIHHPALEDQLGKEETIELAADYGMTLTSYEELESLELIIHYVGRDMDDSRRYFDMEYEKLASFISVSDFARISGIKISLHAGEYRTVTSTGYLENIWVSADCLDRIRHPVTGDERELTFSGTVEFDNLAVTSEPFAFLLSDEDYLRFSRGLTKDWKERHVFFNVENQTESYVFADAWKQAYINRATAHSDHYRLYDAYEEAQALAAGGTYNLSGSVGLSADNMKLMGDWKYAPFSRILQKADAMELVAVFVLLSLYISVIALAAAGIMSYVRSITIAMDNRQLFEDLKKLGAENAYEERIIRMQLRKIFAWPVAAGCALTGIFSLLLTYFNDMHLQVFELRMLFLEMLMMVAIAGVMYGIYRSALGKTRQIVGITLSAKVQ